LCADVILWFLPVSTGSTQGKQNCMPGWVNNECVPLLGLGLVLVLVLVLGLVLVLVRVLVRTSGPVTGRTNRRGESGPMNPENHT
jgi:hypothetical protein